QMNMTLARSMLCCAVATLSLAAHGQSYPTKPVRVVVAFAVGGFADGVARLVGQKLSERLGQPVVVDNRGGAGGNIATRIVAAAPSDGYTLLVNTAAISINASLYRNPGFDIYKDFVPVALTGSTPGLFAVHASNPAGSLQELIRSAKGKNLTYATAGVGSSSHLAAEMFNAAAGLNSVHVPFKAIGDIFAEMYGGRIQYYLFPLPAVMPVLREGKIRAIATGGRARAVALPQVPTMSEAGLPGFVSETYFGLLGPAGVPKKVIGRINTETDKQLKTDDLKTRFQNGGADAASSTPEGFYKIQQAEQERVKKIIQDIGLKPQF
ncbi:MAG: Bug family tripartite tricarboxylate transporter substrate binding protein, partial [Burkholderiales bacterium]